MATRRLRFTFPPEKIKEPVIWRIGRDFDIVTNIRRADVDETKGWVVLELEGAEGAIERAVVWAAGIGVQVDPVPGDVVEG